LLGYFAIGDGKGALGFKIAGYVVMMSLGFGVLVSGVTVENGEATLTTVGGVTTVQPAYDEVDNGGLVIGVPLVLVALLGIMLSIAQNKDSNNPYYADGKPLA